VAGSILVITLLGVIALLSTGIGQSPNISKSTSSGTSLSTQTAQNTTTTFTTTLSTRSGPIVPASGSPGISSEQEWNVNLTGYSYPPNLVSFDPNSDEVYVSGAPSPLVTVVDSKTHHVSGTFEIPGTISVGEILPDSKAGTLLAFAETCQGEPDANASTCDPGNVELHLFELNESSKTVIRELPFHYESYAAFDFATGVSYALLDCPNPHGGAGNQVLPNCGFLLKYDLATGALLDNVSLNAPLSSIAVNPETGMVYFIAGSTFGGYSEDFVTFNGTDNQIVSKVPFDTISTPVLQVDPSTNMVFSLATNGSSTIITAVNGSTGEILYSSPIGSACSVDSNRYSVNPVTNQIYASDYNDTAGNYLLVVNASDGHLVNMISTLGNVYEDSTSNPATGEAYVLLGKQLVALPPELSQTYVNPGILTFSDCQDEPM
jgi:hypothetical protein